MMRMMKPLNRLPREVVGAPSLEAWTLSNLRQWKMSLLVAGVLNWMTFKGPFQSKLFYASKVSQVVFGMICVGLADGFSDFKLWAVSPKLCPQPGSRNQNSF